MLVCSSFSGCELRMSVSMQTLFHMHINAAVCHLDLTPGNVMLETHSNNPYDTVRIIDFGLAKFSNPGKHADSDLSLAA